MIVCVLRKDINMKLKIFLLLFIFLFCSGCEVEYRLVIDEQNTFLESFSLRTENATEDELLIEDPFPYKVFYDDPDLGDYPEKLDGVAYYATEVLQHGLHYEKKFQYEFINHQFYRSSAVRTCYENIYMSEDANLGTMTIRTSSKFLCMESYPNLTNVTIRVHVSQPVITSNADEIIDQEYIWYLNQDNYNKGIFLTIQDDEVKKVEEETSNEQENHSSYFIVFSLLGIFILFLLGIFIYNYKQRNHS